ncbi:hypothetical protein [Marinicella sp. W31]|uniref:hypothetical protein n=1 Tax=Marinicella sp. W31 TaxID=3023713 RepID=UPI0037582441
MNKTPFMQRLAAWFTRKKVYMLIYLAIVGIIALLMQFLTKVHLYHSSLLYILIPYLVSVVITVFRPTTAKTLFQRYISHVLTALSILLSTSILIGEGFVCIIFFAPIYLIVVSFTYLVRAFSKDKRIYSMALPAVILVFSLEGTLPSLTFPRDTFVEIKRTTALTKEQIKANLAKPFDLQKERHWLISIFPMPYRIDAGSLNPGDVHTVYTRYHRWFFTNTHEGQARLLIESVSDNKITTRVLSDDTYFTTYLNGHGTEINLLQNEAGGTDIVFKLFYKRNLDPAWYFYPLQKIGVKKMGELIIDELMLREPS